MFASSHFNQNIGIWVITGMRQMKGMFEKATKFDQDISNWDLSNLPKWRPNIPAKGTNAGFQNPDSFREPPMLDIFLGTVLFEQNLCSESWMKQIKTTAITSTYTASKVQIICCSAGYKFEKTDPLCRANCIMGCVSCNVGTFQKNDFDLATSCMKCEPGSAVKHSGDSPSLLNKANDNDPPLQCESCVKGMYQNEPGDARTSYGCKDCKTGKYAEGTGKSDCDPCPEGTYMELERQDACKDCPEGYFQDEPGTQFCLPCIPGTFNNEIKQTSCKECLKDTFTNQTLQTECKDCSTGEKSDAGSASCQRCGAGEAGTPCVKCLEGEFRAGSDKDATTCDSCPEGRYQNEKGQGSW